MVYYVDWLCIPRMNPTCSPGACNGLNFFTFLIMINNLIIHCHILTILIRRVVYSTFALLVCSSLLCLEVTLSLNQGLLVTQCQEITHIVLGGGGGTMWCQRLNSHTQSLQSNLQSHTQTPCRIFPGHILAVCSKSQMNVLKLTGKFIHIIFLFCLIIPT